MLFPVLPVLGAAVADFGKGDDGGVLESWTPRGNAHGGSSGLGLFERLYRLEVVRLPISLAFSEGGSGFEGSAAEHRLAVAGVGDFLAGLHPAGLGHHAGGDAVFAGLVRVPAKVGGNRLAERLEGFTGGLQVPGLAAVSYSSLTTLV